MRGLRLLLLVDAVAIAATSAISDPIVSDVALLPVLLVAVLSAIACLSADLVPPRRRRDVVCSALSIAAPFAFLALPGGWGRPAAAVALVALQAIPLAGGRRAAREGGAGPGAARRVIAALVLATSLLTLAVVALVWYGGRYLLPAPKGQFARGPYLTRITTREADFAWKTAKQQTVSLRARAPDGTTTTASAGRLTGLRPGTRYVWSADVRGVSAAAGSFRTAPASATAPVRLVAFADYGSGSAHEYAVGRLAAAVRPSLFLSAGDNAYLLAAPPLLDRAIFRPLRPLLGEAATVAALGEHDLAWRDGAAVISALHLPGHQYSVQYGPVQVVVLGLDADASARAYAARALGRCARPCPVRFVLVHRPIEASNAIMPLLRRRRVAAILAGHLHRYERHVRAGVLEFTVGTGGEGAGSAAFTRRTADAIVSFIDYGFLQIDVNGGRVRYAFVDDRGRVRDRVSERVPR